MKTNLYVSTKAAYEVHVPEEIIEENYSDFYHIECSWVSESRKTVIDHGVVYHREAGVWSPAREVLLDRAMLFGVNSIVAKGGLPPIFISHRQTFGSRGLDPDPEIAAAAHRIAEKHKFKLDYDFVRGSGKSAALWYPKGKGKLV
jgi:hypothetical protein